MGDLYVYMVEFVDVVMFLLMVFDYVFDFNGLDWMVVLNYLCFLLCDVMGVMFVGGLIVVLVGIVKYEMFVIV